MSDAVIATSHDYQRATCYVCERRRLCRFVVVDPPFGVGFFVCREHPEWVPVEGRDYERAGVRVMGAR